MANHWGTATTFLNRYRSLMGPEHYRKLLASDFRASFCWCIQQREQGREDFVSGLSDAFPGKMSPATGFLQRHGLKKRLVKFL